MPDNSITISEGGHFGVGGSFTNSIADLVVKVPSLTPDTPCSRVAEVLAENPSAPCLCVASAEDGILGMISRANFHSIMSKPLMSDLYRKRPVDSIMRADPLVVEAAASIESAADFLVKANPEALLDGFLIARGGRYLGVGTAQDLLARSAANARRAAEENLLKSERIAALLDNSGQGFLSFSPDLIVNDDYSRACATILGTEPAGQDISALLFPGTPEHCALMRKAIRNVMEEGDEFRRQMFLSLLPARLLRDGSAIDVSYVVMSDGEKMMLILTDVTDKLMLEENVERERSKLEIIVKATTESRDFFQTVTEFKRFVNAITDITHPERAPQLELDDLYREVHTFKGSFAQFGFHELPKALHSLEDRIAHIKREDHTPPARKNRLLDAFCESRLSLALNKDLRVVVDLFGDDFIANHGIVQIPAQMGKRLQVLAEAILNEGGLPGLSAETRALMQDVANFHRLSLHQALGGFNGLVTRVAERQEKAVAPLRVEGEDVLVDADLYGPLVRSLGHIFRNCVAHGIEPPDEREEADKPEEGEIRCTIARDDAEIILTIADDGAGIDQDRLRAKAAEIFGAEKAAKLVGASLLDTIFLDGLSTLERADETSGRGVGLAAVRAAVLDLGGRIGVTSEAGYGTCFTIHLPRR